jgi:hypothetical protein
LATTPSGDAPHERPEDDGEEAADEAAVPGEADPGEDAPEDVLAHLAPVLGHVVEARADEAAEAGREDDLEGEVGRHAPAAQQRPHDEEAGHDERQRGHEAEAVEGEVADAEEFGVHAVAPGGVRSSVAGSWRGGKRASPPAGTRQGSRAQAGST